MSWHDAGCCGKQPMFQALLTRSVHHRLPPKEVHSPNRAPRPPHNHTHTHPFPGEPLLSPIWLQRTVPIVFPQKTSCIPAAWSSLFLFFLPGSCPPSRPNPLPTSSPPCPDSLLRDPVELASTRGPCSQDLTFAWWLYECPLTSSWVPGGRLGLVYHVTQQHSAQDSAFTQ